MVDVQKMIDDFIARRKKVNEEMANCKGFTPYNEEPKIFVVTYGNGRGCYVIDEEQFHKLPKGTQNKILEMPNRRI